MKQAFWIFVVLYGITEAAVGSQAVFPSDLYKGETFKTGYFASMEDMASTKVVMTTQVADKFECTANCLVHPTCQSFNFQVNGNPKHLCELSDVGDQASVCNTKRPGYSYFFTFQLSLASVRWLRKDACKNGGIPLYCGNNCTCKEFNKGQYCQEWTSGISSCKDIFDKTSYRENRAYTFPIDGKQTDIYCHMTDNANCGGGGWTMVMKIDGNLNDFEVNSPFWTNKESFHLTAGQTGFDQNQTKMPSYWAIPFQKLCIGFKLNNAVKLTVIPYNASSLFDVIGDGVERRFTSSSSIPKAQWMSIIAESSMQTNCNLQGFNVAAKAPRGTLVRLGLLANNEDYECDSLDSALGFGFKAQYYVISAGNKCRVYCSNKEKTLPAFGYIMVK